MVLGFYFDNVSQVCRAVYLFLKGTGVDFEPKVVELLKGRLKYAAASTTMKKAFVKSCTNELALVCKIVPCEVFNYYGIDFRI